MVAGFLPLLEQVGHLGKAPVLQEHIDQFAADFVLFEQFRRFGRDAREQCLGFEVDELRADGHELGQRPNMKALACSDGAQILIRH